MNDDMKTLCAAIGKLVRRLETQQQMNRQVVETIRRDFRMLCIHEWEVEDSVDGTVHICRYCGKMDY